MQFSLFSFKFSSYSLAMEFCLGCGSDLPSSKKDVRNLSFGYSASYSATVEVTSTWKHLMVEVVESQGFSYNRVFT